jgi:hypothetical protein
MDLLKKKWYSLHEAMEIIGFSTSTGTRIAPKIKTRIDPRDGRKKLVHRSEVEKLLYIMECLPEPKANYLMMALDLVNHSNGAFKHFFNSYFD